MDAVIIRTHYKKFIHYWNIPTAIQLAHHTMPGVPIRVIVMPEHLEDTREYLKQYDLPLFRLEKSKVLFPPLRGRFVLFVTDSPEGVRGGWWPYLQLLMWTLKDQVWFYQREPSRFGSAIDAAVRSSPLMLFDAILNRIVYWKVVSRSKLRLVQTSTHKELTERKIGRVALVGALRSSDIHPVRNTDTLVLREGKLIRQEERIKHIAHTLEQIESDLVVGITGYPGSKKLWELCIAQLNLLRKHEDISVILLGTATEANLSWIETQNFQFSVHALTFASTDYEYFLWGSKCTILINPLHPVLPRTKGTGGFADAIFLKKPLITPKHLVSSHHLPFCIPYENEAELVALLQPARLIQLQQQIQRRVDWTRWSVASEAARIRGELE